MRRSTIFLVVLATGVAVLGACSGAPNNTTVTKPNTAATPAPIATASPAASPAASPSIPPAKPAASPEGKKPDPKSLNNDAKPMATETPRSK
ncbi:MAG: hypothetical protein ACKVQJ_07980 [Pyrinomonadaceae bacterium]